jgi:hypothetical protein
MNVCQIPSVHIIKYKQMKTKELISEIQKLPLMKRIYVIEHSIRLIRKQEEERQMEIAAEALYEDYMNNKELTEFTNLDFESFYEAR